MYTKWHHRFKLAEEHASLFKHAETLILKKSESTWTSLEAQQHYQLQLEHRKTVGKLGWLARRRYVGFGECNFAMLCLRMQMSWSSQSVHTWQKTSKGNQAPLPLDLSMFRLMVISSGSWCFSMRIYISNNIVHIILNHLKQKNPIPTTRPRGSLS